MTKPARYPAFICHTCGEEYGQPERVRKGLVSTFHFGLCDICGREDLLTEPRDYGHLKPGWEEGQK